MSVTSCLPLLGVYGAVVAACWWRFGWRPVARWHAWTASITAAGSVLGGILFLAVGTIAGMELSARQLLLNGLRDGGFYAFIWAPGCAMVLCLIHAHNQARN
jgi:hypothetical protein